MQATVSAYDERTRAGKVLLDDGVEIPFSSSVFDASGLRLLRTGQRVRVAIADVDGIAQVSTLQILTLPDFFA